MILDRYIFRLWLWPFLGGLALVMGVFLLSRALRLMDMAADVASAWGMLSHLLFLTVPYFVLLACPVAFFLSLQYVISHLQATSELDALRAAGVSHLRLLRAPLFSALFLFAGLLLVAMWWMPSALADFNSLMRQIYATSGGVAVVPQRFNQAMDDLVIYAGGDKQNGELSQVLIEDRRGSTEVLYIAESARVHSTSGRVHISLQRGARFEGRGDTLRFLKFDDYSVSLEMKGGRWYPGNRKNDPMLMGPRQLISNAANGLAHAQIELARRFLLPSMVLLLFFFALPISLRPKRSATGGVYILGIALVLVAYNLYLFFYRLAMDGSISVTGFLSGQLLLFLTGGYLFLSATRDRLPMFLDVIVQRLGEAGTLLVEWFRLRRQ